MNSPITYVFSGIEIRYATGGDENVLKALPISRTEKGLRLDMPREGTKTFIKGALKHVVG